VHNQFGERQKALELFSMALTLLKEIGDQKGQAITLNNMGLAYAHLGDAARALACYNQAIPAYQAVGDQEGFEAATRNIHALYADRRNSAALATQAAVNGKNILP